MHRNKPDYPIDDTKSDPARFTLCDIARFDIDETNTSISKYQWKITHKETPNIRKRKWMVYYMLLSAGDWQSSSAIHRVAQNYFNVRNRITWEREKGRGAKTNWKNCAEDIWFCTLSNEYTFNVDCVKMKRKVIAPYKDGKGNPKDWHDTDTGKFRMTHPSNLWTDISIPFWSMPENTDHPTQKPEKLIAKLILASSNEGDVVFDPFLGSGTTSVVAKKLNRQYFGIEIDKDYCCLTEKRLSMIENNKFIQGYSGGYFWERNTLAEQMKSKDDTNAERHQFTEKNRCLNHALGQQKELLIP